MPLGQQDIIKVIEQNVELLFDYFTNEIKKDQY